MYESDDHAEHSEDNIDDGVGVPDARPTKPEAQQLQALPLYALPAQRESGPGNSYASNCAPLKEPMLNHRYIQASVPRDCLDELDQAVMEM